MATATAPQGDPEFLSALVDSNFSASVKLLDTAIKAAVQGKAQPAAHAADVAQLYINRGFCNQKLQLYRKALKDYDEALQLCPHHLLALYRKGQVLTALKKPADARGLWSDALRLVTPSTDAALVLDLAAAVRNPMNASVVRDLAACGAWAGRGGEIGVKATAVLCLVLVAAVLQPHAHQHLQQLSAAIGMKPGLAPDATPVSNGHSYDAALSHSTYMPAPVTPSSASTQPRSPPSPPPAAAAKVAAQPSPPQPGKPPSSRTPAAASDAVEEVDAAALQASASAARQNGNSHRPSPAFTSAPAVPAATAAAKSSPSKAAGGSGAGRGSSSTQAPASDGDGGGVGGLPGLKHSAAIQLAVTQINAGQIKEAEKLLDQVIASAPKELGARVARGTARALHRDLKGAVEDFSVAIELEPRYSDSWKRRGQARSALGDSAGALTDLQKAVDLMPMWGADAAPARAECLVEKAMIYQKLRDYRKACKDMEEAVKLDGSNPQAWNIMGLCSISQGNIRDGVRAYEKAVALSPNLREAWTNMAQALKEEGRYAQAEQAFTKVLALDAAGQPNVPAMRVLGQMRQQKGEHALALTVLTDAIAAQREDQMIELLYLRAICYHALGYIKEAVRDYEDCLAWSRGPTPGEETRAFQFLSFYQKELALYLYKSFDRAAASFCPDAELSALFKETWCKKGPPSAELISTYSPMPPVPISPGPKPPLPPLDKLRPLTRLADQLGLLLQNDHQGFMANTRQQRAAGYAAIELAQTMQGVVKDRRSGRQTWVSSEGSSSQAGSAGRHQFGWRDAMDIVVKWRQLAEPNDQVVWVDLLTRREFENGFGSHTPMFSGQTKCVRYYMNFPRALNLQREVLLREGHAFSANNRPIPVGSASQKEAIAAAQTAEDMYLVIQQDSWVVVQIESFSRPNHKMEGTRLTLVKVPNQPDAYEFSIRTPVTPPRWKDFDAELEVAWENIVNAMAANAEPRVIADAIMVYGYYWYNFMPLARGTAAAGYATILSLFWAAGMPVTARIPKNVQVDWEAILSQHPQDFIASVSPWLYPEAARTPSNALMGAVDISSKGTAVTTGKESAPTSAPTSASNSPAKEGSATDAGGTAVAVMPVFPSVDTVPRAGEVLLTIRNRLEALNGEGARRV